MSDVVAVEQIGRLSGVDQAAFELDRDRRFARGRQPGQQHRRAPLIDREPALVAIERRRVPGDVAPVLASRLDRARCPDHSCRDGLVAVLVDQDERPGDAIEGVGVGHHRRIRAEPHLADVVERRARSARFGARASPGRSAR